MLEGDIEVDVVIVVDVVMDVCHCDLRQFDSFGLLPKSLLEMLRGGVGEILSANLIQD